MARSSSKELRAILRRRRWTAEEASAVLDAVAASGLSLNGFATRHGLQPCRLYRWSRQLRRGAAQVEPVGFEEVPVPVPAADEWRDDDRIEVALPSGHVVRLGASFDDGALRRLLAVLGEAERPC